MAMITRSYTVKFNTPAFLGDASQNGAWRTPPIKAVLRYWWRIAFAARNRHLPSARLLAEMRDEEHVLFGHVPAETDTKTSEESRKKQARASEIRIRLDPWAMGNLEKSQLRGATVVPPGSSRAIDALQYLGYGPLGNRETADNRAIAPHSSAKLQLAFPAANAEIVDMATYLCHRFAAIGGRSSNGWGSFSLVEDAPQDTPSCALRDFLDGFEKALENDWATCIGEDHNGPLVWQFSASFKDWQSAMKGLAAQRIGMKRSVPKLHRKWLGFVEAKQRLPNGLRFKVREDEGGLVGVIFHCPSLPPEDYRAHSTTVAGVWRQAHAYLDDQSNLERVKV